MEHQNLKISIRVASKDESPYVQNCEVQEDLSYYKWYAILPGTLFKVDVSFYQGIKRAVFKYSSYDGSVFATAYASNGRVIERQQRKPQFNTFVFEKDLADLKEITLVATGEVFTPVSITLN